MEIELNILFLPLLGGYLFYCTFHGSQYVAGRRPKSIAIFWWAGVGLILLVIARVATMAAQWSLHHKVQLAPNILLVCLPPVLCLTIVGIVLHAVTSLLQGQKLLTSASSWKVVMGFAFVSVATWVTLTLMPAAHALAARTAGTTAALYLPWAIAFLACFVAANWWARKYRMAVGAVVFRMSLVSIVIIEIITIAFAYLPLIKNFWTEFTGPLGGQTNNDAIGLAALACLLGPLGSIALNFMLPRTVAASRHFESDWVNGFEELVYSAAQKGRMLALSLSNRKVYVGHVEWVPPHPEANDAYIQVIPQFSGYRLSRTLELRLTISYDGIYRDLHPSEFQRYRKVIPISRIITASEFDTDTVASSGNIIVPAPTRIVPSTDHTTATTAPPVTAPSPRAPPAATPAKS